MNRLAEVIYIIEFKLDGTDALAQLKSRKYYEKYLTENRPIYLVGIEFSIKERNVSKIMWENWSQ